jgi:hypothetical protein
VIGSITKTSETALYLGPILEQMCWPRDKGSYDQLRDEARERLLEMGLEEASMPAEQDAYLDSSASEIRRAVLDHLSADRAKINGDVLGLPLFMLTVLSYRSVIGIVFGTRDQQHLEEVEECLEDLGVDRNLVEVLEREAGGVSVEAEGDEEEPGAHFSDLVLAGGSFIVRILEEFGRSEPGIEAVERQIRALETNIGEFRMEARDRDARIEALVREGNSEVTAALDEVKDALVRNGLDPSEATALTEGDPRGLWERLRRWKAHSPAGDAAEQALWAALDFVPAGVSVKLGIKVLQAIRGSLKSSAESG